MILRNISTILHGSPQIPSFDTVAGLPDALTPDNVFNLERDRVIHNPFGNFLA